MEQTPDGRARSSTAAIVGQVVELVPVRVLRRRFATLCRHLPLSAEIRERLQIDLILARFIRRIREPMAVRRQRGLALIERAVDQASNFSGLHGFEYGD